MIIENVRVYGLEESIIASGYPMRTEITDFEGTEKDIERAKKLGSCKVGAGHDCYLKGIIVQADITAPQYWWLQFERYHFADIVSSQSKMHRILKMDIYEQCNEYVHENAIALMQDLIRQYKTMIELKYPSEKCNRKFQEIIANCPMGLMLTARITTNYLQLKTMYYQRKNHKLEEWREIFCQWILSLPKFKELIE